jgi:D-alanyl-D-alanine carboxypeptidase/D-alanyl-D-alanine-endopeptidase (penicillin-binding protein 4)
LSRTRWYVVGGLAVVTALVVGLDAAGVIFEPGAESPEPQVVTAPSPGPPEPALSSALPGDVPSAEAARLGRAVERALSDEALGPRVSASVVSVDGTTLLDLDAERTAVPASTVKLFTALAALDVLGPDRRIATRVVSGESPRSVVLVGGGDATLAADKPTRGRLRGACLESLAAATARSLSDRGVSRVRLSYDTSLFTGPAVAPTWGDTYVSSGVVAPVTALMVDQGLVDLPSGSLAREPDPALAAAGRFASLLEGQGVTVAGRIASASAPDGADLVAEVSSPPVASLVEQMLTDSDNQLAEALGRLVAIGSGRPASFAGAGAALVAQAQLRDVDVSGAKLFDASGLSRSDRLPPAGLGGVLTVAASDAQLRPLTLGLPVAALTGTLVDRYLDGRSARGAGVVRAKTGTLTGVSAEAGLTVTCDGHLVAFAFVADRVELDTDLARAALDRGAASLAACPPG